MQNITLNGFTLLRYLGQGGMAEVWYAKNTIGREAAVKIMLSKFIGDKTVVKRFETEAHAMFDLDHPNIRKVFDFGIYQERPFLIMEYLDGFDLSAFVKKGKKFTPQELTNWWKQSLEALNYMHHKRIIHRDIKPSNIFLETNGNIKLLDFGIAKVLDGVNKTLTGFTLGTYAYMSPEQVLNPKTVTSQTDIFSLAVTFATLLKGRIPYENTESEYGLQENIVNQKIDLAGINQDWLQRLHPCLIKDATQRSTAIKCLQNLQSIGSITAHKDHTIVADGDDEKTRIDTISYNPTPSQHQHQHQNFNNNNNFFNENELEEKFISVTPRIRRRDFGIRNLLMNLPFISFVIASESFPWASEDVMISTLVVLVIVSLVLQFTNSAKRLKDIKASLWTLLLLIIPYINILFILMLIFLPSSNNQNPNGVNSYIGKQTWTKMNIRYAIIFPILSVLVFIIFSIFNNQPEEIPPTLYEDEYAAPAVEEVYAAPIEEVYPIVEEVPAPADEY